MAAPSSAVSKPLTYRVENIPSGTSNEDLKGCFHPDDRNYIKVKSLVPSVDTAESEDDSDYTATIFFRPPDASRAGPRLIDEALSLDKEFLGFTPLYVPPREKGPIVADIIAVTGLAGHAYGSWAHSPERMWLRDYLPKDAPNARILTYGYPSKLQGNESMSILSDHTNTFLHRLMDMRVCAQCESRPIIFIGHSLGCLIIKKALIDVGLMGFNIPPPPVRAIVFIAAPHRGLEVTALQSLVKGTATEQLILELKSGSPTLTDINQRFATYIAKDIDILTCYETQPTKTAILVDGLWKREGTPVMMVSPDSASIHHYRERRVPVDTNHSQIAKIMKGESGIYLNIKSAIRHGLRNSPKSMPGVATNPDQKFHIKEFQNNNDLVTPALQNTAIRHASLLNRSESSAELSFERLTIGEQERFRSSSPPQSQEESTKELGNVTENMRSGNSVSHQDAVAQNLHDSTNLAPSGGSKPDRKPSAVPGATAWSPAQNERSSQPFRGSGQADLWRYCDHCSKHIPVTELRFRCHRGDYWDQDTCQQCYAKGFRCNKDATHTMVRCVVKTFGSIRRHVPYAETTVSEQDSALVKAIKERETKDLDRLARYTDDLNAQSEDGYTSLHLAAQLGFMEGAKVLLEHGATRDSRDLCNHTPLMHAVQYACPEIVQLLLDQGADINAIGSYNGNSTALHLAAVGCQSDMIALLLQNKAKIDAVSSGGTALCLAAGRGDVKSVEILIDAGASINLAGPDLKETPLSNAAYNGRSEVVKILLGYRVACRMDIDEKDVKNKTSLFYAIQEGYVEVTKLLLDAGANPNIKCGKKEASSLCAAARLGRSSIVKTILQYPVDIDEPDYDGDSPLMSAALNGNKDICQQLLDHNADVDFRNPIVGNTVLMEAVFKGYLDIVRLLVKYKVQTDLATKSGYGNALSFAARYGRMEVLKYLLNSGASPFPPPLLKDWNSLEFVSSVSLESKKDIQNMLLKAHKKAKKR